MALPVRINGKSLVCLLFEKLLSVVSRKIAYSQRCTASDGLVCLLGR